jgi:hypothetical protein
MTALAHTRTHTPVRTPRACTTRVSRARARAQVDQWLDTASQLVSGLGFEPLCGRLNDYLSLRSFLVGYEASAADFAVWGQLHGARARCRGRGVLARTGGGGGRRVKHGWCCARLNCQLRSTNLLPARLLAPHTHHTHTTHTPHTHTPSQPARCGKRSRALAPCRTCPAGLTSWQHCQTASLPWPGCASSRRRQRRQRQTRQRARAAQVRARARQQQQQSALVARRVVPPLCVLLLDTHPHSAPTPPPFSHHAPAITTNARVHARTHARMHARTHTHIHAHVPAAQGSARLTSGCRALSRARSSHASRRSPAATCTSGTPRRRCSTSTLQTCTRAACWCVAGAPCA